MEQENISTDNEESSFEEDGLEQTESSILNPQEIKEEAPEKPEEVKVKYERPEYWPEDLWDKESNAPKLKDVYDKLQNQEERIDGFRKAMAKKGKVPEEYKFEGLPEEIANNHEVLDVFSEAAKEAGLSNDQANSLFKRYYEQAKARDDQAYEIHVKTEHEKLGPDAEYVIGSIDNFINQRLNNKTFSQAEADALRSSITSAEAARALAKAIELTGEMRIPGSVRSASDTGSLSDVKQEMTEAYLNIKDRNEREKVLKGLRAKLERFENDV